MQEQTRARAALPGQALPALKVGDPVNDWHSYLKLRNWWDRWVLHIACAAFFFIVVVILSRIL